MPAPDKNHSVAVVLLNFGGPRSLAEVGPFLYEILRDPNTIQLPAPIWVQNLLARAIVARRTPETQRQYGEIGGKSPIVAASAALAAAVQARAEGPGDPLPVLVSHRYLPGWARETARKIAKLGAQSLFAVPLYPHFSYATTGSALEQLAGELRAAGYRGKIAALRSYPDAAGYLDALGERLQSTLSAAAPPPRTTVVLCSAHGLPASYVARGDPYRREIDATVAGLRARFPGWRLEISFQSRVGPAEWLRPYTRDSLAALAGEGVSDVVFLPLSFVNDHIETLYEIGQTYFGQTRGLGMTPHLVPAVETHPAFVDFLADAIKQWRAGGQGEPLAALLPPDQSWRRVGVWRWGLWLLAFVAVLLLALL